MKTTDIIRNYETTARKRAEKQSMLAKLKDQKTELDKKMEAALTAGDKDEYKRLHAQAEDLALEISIVEHQVIINPVTPEDLQSAWVEYRKEEGKNLAKRLDKVQKAKLAVKEATEDMLRFRNDTLKERAKIAEIINVDPASLELDPIPEDRMNVPPVVIKNSEAIYLTSCGLWPLDHSRQGNDSLQDAYHILNGRPVDKLHFDD